MRPWCPSLSRSPDGRKYRGDQPNGEQTARPAALTTARRDGRHHSAMVTRVLQSVPQAPQESPMAVPSYLVLVSPGCTPRRMGAIATIPRPVPRRASAHSAGTD